MADKSSPKSRHISKRFIAPASDERVAIVGATGSGKTYASLAMLSRVGRLVVVDSRDDLNDSYWMTSSWSPSNRARLESGEAVRTRVVYDRDVFDALQVAYEAQNVIIYIDEVTALIPEHKPAPPIVEDIWKRGRKRNVGGWAATQRPVSIPLLFLSEANHYFCFRLQLEVDRKRMSEFMGPQVLERPLDRWGFWYYSVGDERPFYFRGVRF